MSQKSTRMIRLSKGDDVPSFFCIPGAASTPVSLYLLATSLTNERTFYSYLYPGLNDDAEIHDDPLKLADDILLEIRALQPMGPYYLGGYCLGGILAFEIADRLIQAGEKVELLTLFDTLPPIQLGRAGQSILVGSELPSAVQRRNQKLIKNPAFYNTNLETKLDLISPEFGNRIRQTRNAHNLAMTKYSANRIDTNLTLFRTDSYMPEDEVVWEQFTNQNFTSIEIDCEDKILIENPGVTILAEKLDQVMMKLH